MRIVIAGALRPSWRGVTARCLSDVLLGVLPSQSKRQYRSMGKHFWTHSPDGLTRHVILGTDRTGQRLAIRESRQDSSSVIVVCRPDGLVLEEWLIPTPGRLNSIEAEPWR